MSPKYLTRAGSLESGGRSDASPRSSEFITFIRFIKSCATPRRLPGLVRMVRGSNASYRWGLQQSLPLAKAPGIVRRLAPPYDVGAQRRAVRGGARLRGSPV